MFKAYHQTEVHKRLQLNIPKEVVFRAGYQGRSFENTMGNFLSKAMSGVMVSLYSPQYRLVWEQDLLPPLDEMETSSVWQLLDRDVARIQIDSYNELRQVPPFAVSLKAREREGRLILFWPEVASDSVLLTLKSVFRLLDMYSVEDRRQEYMKAKDWWPGMLGTLHKATKELQLPWSKPFHYKYFHLPTFRQYSLERDPGYLRLR